jgi:hypothetical protein
VVSSTLGQIHAYPIIIIIIIIIIITILEKYMERKSSGSGLENQDWRP